ncbi:MAG: site-specific integrase [Limnochordales bacterium]|nr:site-specific integrase [Limnochordales bacterium]
MVGYKPDGTRDRRVVYGKTRQEVAEKLAELAASAGQGILPNAGTPTVEAFLTQWLEHHKQFGGRDGGPLRPNTVRDYSVQLRLHIIPAIGQLRLDKVTPRHLQALYSQILQKGLSPRRAEMAHKLLHVAFEAAVKEGLLTRNPCDLIADPPRAVKHEVAFLTKEQARLMLEEAKKSVAYLPLLLAFSTGMRRGEILGLRWRNVDLQHGVIHVVEQLQRDGLQPLKTQQSRRDIPMPPELWETLKRHRASQKVISLDGFVCTGRHGGPVSAQHLDHMFAAIRDRLGLDKRLTLHSTRKSFATWLADAGVDPKTIAALLGHGDVRTTLAIYQGVTLDMARRAVSTISGLTASTGPEAQLQSNSSQTSHASSSSQA